MSEKNNILVLENDPLLRKAILKEAQRISKDSTTADTLEDAAEKLKSGNYKVFFVGSCESEFPLEFVMKCCEADPELKPILILSNPLQEEIDNLMAYPQMKNFIAVNEGLAMRELTATLTKLSGNDILGLEHYLVNGTDIKSIRVCDSSQKETYITEACDFLEDKKRMSSRTLTKLSTIMDELLMNMLWDAPIENGKHLYKHLARTERVVLSEAHSARLSVGYDGQFIGLSALDPFGGLRHETVLKYFKKCFYSENQIGSEGGGAGLGLFLAYNYSSQFIMNVIPDKATEFILLFDPNLRSSSDNLVKSYNFFEGVSP